jgi:glycosyltransferase involved in cell wall biosynthesis
LGALPEVVNHDVTGFVVDSVEEMVSALARTDEIDPSACHSHVQQNFSAARMADDYQQMYARVIDSAARTTAA